MKNNYNLSADYNSFKNGLTHTSDGKYIEFPAIAFAYPEDEFRHEFNSIFSAVAAYSYWTTVRNAQLSGVDSDYKDFIERNIDSYCEKAEYVENRQRVSLLRAIRTAVRLNSDLHRRGYPRFIKTVLRKTDNGLFDLFEVMKFCDELISDYAKFTKRDITEKNWMKEG